METARIKTRATYQLKKWWGSLLVLPFVIYSTHQIYWALRYNIFFAVNYSYPFPLNIVYFFVDNFLLIVHEAGHTFFSILGVRFITILGGSLFQILLPLGILAYFWINRKAIGIQLSLVLLGYSWLDVAAYAADGGARQMPLIGGLSKAHHDWYNLLARMHLLEYDFNIALAFVGIGVLCYLLALVLPIFWREYKEVSLELEV